MEGESVGTYGISGGLLALWVRVVDCEDIDSEKGVS